MAALDLYGLPCNTYGKPYKEARMLNPLLVRLHVAASASAITLIATFLASSGITELTGGAGDIRVLRHGVVLGLALLVACLATAGLTGRHLAGDSRSAIVRRKQRRLQVAAAVGVLVLVPCALILNHLAAGPTTSRAFTALEVTEFLFGTVNLSLLVANFRDGRRMTRHRRPAQVAERAGRTP
jgi:hypothetical protein